MNAKMIWITGLSGAGKTTLACALQEALPPPVVVLDGDVLRGVLEYGEFGYDTHSRWRIGHTYARLARMLTQQGITVICSVVVMIEDVRHWNRKNIPNYCEIFLDVPMEILKQRDHKGVYSGKSSVVGLDLQQEIPSQPNLILPWNQSVEANVATILQYIRDHCCPANVQ